MRIQLGNNYLTTEIDCLGAELKVVKETDLSRDYLWRADPQFWGRTSPVLFPIVGRLTDNTTLIDDQQYHMPQHGFARDLVFDCIEQRDDFLLFKLSSNEQTRTHYPFDFELYISYTLQERTVTVSWQVINPNTGVMPFSIGAHPAFSTELAEGDQFEDYDIIFDQHKQYHLWQLNDAMQLVDKAIPFQQPLQQFSLSYHYFEIDALVFPHRQLNNITLKSRKHGHGVSVDFSGFPEVALWTADGKHKRSPFLCIEPWFGHADVENGAPELIHKKGILHLAAGETFTASYRMTFF